MRVAFLGDSLTEGRPGAAYFPLLERRLSRHGLLNLGRAGDTVADLLARMRSTRLPPVDAAVLWVGANDAVTGAWDMPESTAGRGWPQRLAHTRAEYRELIEWIGMRTRRSLLVKPIILESEGSLWAARADDLGRMIEDLGAGSGAEVLDLRPAFARAHACGSGPFTIDGVHFTDAGAQVVAAAFAAALERAGQSPSLSVDSS